MLRNKILVLMAVEENAEENEEIVMIAGKLITTSNR